MDRSPTVLSVALFATTLLALTPITTRWADQKPVSGGLTPTGGRLEIEVDEHEVGLVPADQRLEVCFVVGNVGPRRLLLRQTATSSADTPVTSYPTYCVPPGQRVAITACCDAKELVPQGVTRVLFLTSDEACPRLWLSIRGTCVVER